MTIYAMQGFELLGNVGTNPSGLLAAQGWEFRVPSTKNTSGIVINGTNSGKGLALITSSTAGSNNSVGCLRYRLDSTIPSGTQLSFGVKLSSNVANNDSAFAFGYGFSGFMHFIYLLTIRENLGSITFRRALNSTSLPESDGSYNALVSNIPIGNASGWQNNFEVSFALRHTSQSVTYLTNNNSSGTASLSQSSFAPSLTPQVNEIYIGHYRFDDNDSYSNNPQIRLDDFYFKSGTFIDNYNNSAIRHLSLASDVSNTNWSGQDGSTSNLYTLLDENPSNDDTDYVHTNTLGSSYLAQKTAVSGVGIRGRIHAVKITTTARNVNSDNPLIQQANMTGNTTTLQSSLLTKGASTYSAFYSIVSFIPGTQSGLNNVIVDNATFGFRL